MPFAAVHLVEAARESMNPIDFNDFLYNNHTYYDTHVQAYVQTNVGFEFPKRMFIGEIEWVRYMQATDKAPERWIIRELPLCEALKNHLHLFRIHGQFYDDMGARTDDSIKATIMKWIQPFVETNIARAIGVVFAALQAHCETDPPALCDNKVYTAGGYTLTIDEDGTLTSKYEPDAVTTNRLPVRYNPDAPVPTTFLKFLYDLVSPDDAVMVQQYCGYMLVPSTRCQAALFLRCDGGGGKSTLLDILSRLFGSSSIKGKLGQLAQDRFMLALLEGKLAFFDDDLETSLLEETGIIKSIITANSPMTAQRKGKDGFQFQPYARILAAGNVFPGAAHDRSDGLYRRLRFIECKPKPADRVVDNDLARKIIENEMPGVLKWAIEGLKMLKENGFNLYVSDESKDLVARKQLEDNPVEQFMQDTDWIAYGSNMKVATASLIDSFKLWCSINAVVPPKDSTISKEVARQAKKRGCGLSKTVKINAIPKRGYEGIGLTKQALDRLNGCAGYSYSQYARQL